MANWFQNYGQIKAFAKVMYQADIIDDVPDMLAYMDQPKAYDEAYQLWVSKGQPDPDDEEWDEFVAGIEVEESVEIENDGN